MEVVATMAHATISRAMAITITVTPYATLATTTLIVVRPTTMVLMPHSEATTRIAATTNLLTKASQTR